MGREAKTRRKHESRRDKSGCTAGSAPEGLWDHSSCAAALGSRAVSEHDPKPCHLLLLSSPLPSHVAVTFRRAKALSFSPRLALPRARRPTPLAPEVLYERLALALARRITPSPLPTFPR